MAKKQNTPAETATSVTDTAVATVSPAKKNYTLFSVGASDSVKVKKVLSVRILSPKEMPEGAHFVAKVTGFCDSPVSTFKNRLIEFENAAGLPFRFPMMAVVARSLGMTEGKEKLSDAKLREKEKAWVGRWLFVQYTGEAPKKEEGKAPTKNFNVAEVDAPEPVAAE